MCDANALHSLAEAAQLDFLPVRRNGRRLCFQTLYSWARVGIGGVRLRVCKVGSTTCTTENWLREFFDALAEADSLATQSEAAGRARKKSRTHAAAEHELDAAGV